MYYIGVIGNYREVMNCFINGKDKFMWNIKLS